MRSVAYTLRVLALAVLLIFSLIGFDRAAGPWQPASSVPPAHPPVSASWP